MSPTAALRYQHADGSICVHVLRTKTEVLTLDRAQHLVVQRMRRLEARRRPESGNDRQDRHSGLSDPKVEVVSRRTPARQDATSRRVLASS